MPSAPRRDADRLEDRVAQVSGKKLPVGDQMSNDSGITTRPGIDADRAIEPLGEFGLVERTEERRATDLRVGEQQVDDLARQSRIE